MKYFEILSRTQAKRRSYKVSDSTVIISINDSTDGFNSFSKNPNIKAVCSLFFDDIISKNENGILMSEEDAEKIKNFINKWWDRADRLIVHCYAGISRSSGCMSAILQSKGIDDSWVWSGKYSPNIYVAKMIKRAFGFTIDNYEELWQELLKKEIQ